MEIEGGRGGEGFVTQWTDEISRVVGKLGQIVGDSVRPRIDLGHLGVDPERVGERFELMIRAGGR